MYLRKSSKMHLYVAFINFSVLRTFKGLPVTKKHPVLSYIFGMNQSCGQTLGGAGERRHNRDSSQNMIVEREPARGPRYNQHYPGGISIWCECVHTNNEYLTCWHFLPDTRCVCGRWSGSSSSRQAPYCSHQRRSVRGEGG